MHSVWQSSLFQQQSQTLPQTFCYQYVHTSVNDKLQRSDIMLRESTRISAWDTVRRVMRMHACLFVFYKHPFSQSSFPLQSNELIVAHNRHLWSKDSKPIPDLSQPAQTLPIVDTDCSELLISEGNSDRPGLSSRLCLERQFLCRSRQKQVKRTRNFGLKQYNWSVNVVLIHVI